MVSHSIAHITWVPVTKTVWSHVSKKTVPFKFLRWNLSDEYNHKMNDNNVADQLHLVYRMQRFQRNHKWWWLLFIWMYEGLMANSYKMMERYIF